jgi:hypothetical protein
MHGAHLLPWPIGLIALALLAGWGSAFLFFTDRIAEWQIRRLQANWYRVAMRISGGLFLAIGLFLFVLSMISLLNP